MRIVIKIGTSTLAYPTGHLNIRRVEELCKVISDIKNAGNQVIVVSSGAIAMGVGKLGLQERPSDIPTKQAAAAVGQCELMYIYDKLFGEFNHAVAQLLITGEDVENDNRHQNFSNTLARLLELDVIPIINENDTVATKEIVIGDNDTLAAIVAQSVKADKLVLLSDIDGLYTADPHKDPNAKLITVAHSIDDSILALAGGSGSNLGTGGMVTKLEAAKICLRSGCDMIITNGNNPNNLYDIMNGKPVGTTFTEKVYA
ncbi:MAG: glutamate 5-kinase [Ruminococcaceae bacterium]|nr:glutamate 5-kinase [Oscillospiraceae bacterium]